MKIVIVGNGPAAVTAAETLRTLDQTCEITIINKEEGPCYSPCPLAEYVEGSVSRDSLFIRDHGFYERLNINTLFGRAATGVDTVERKVYIDNGSWVSYDRLLLAHGAKAFLPPIPGLEAGRDGLFALKTLADADGILAKAKGGASHAVVIGSGFIGLEAAQGLVRLGLSVTVLETRNQVLPNMLDADMAATVQQILEDGGIDIRLSANTQEIIGTQAVSGVRVDGEILPCDLVVCATGVRADISIVKGTDIATNRGIIVDETMQTSIPGVFAAGDIIEADDLDGNRTVTPTWPNAVNSGRIAACNMLGVKKRYAGLELFNVLRVFDVPTGSFGALKGDEIVEYHRKGVRKKLAITDGRIAGLQVIGDIDNMGLYMEMMKKGYDLSLHGEEILEPGFGYANTFMPIISKSVFNAAAV
ncbi:MAG: FAD-dependent oxidoreductase [Candidatus Thiodiazotropha sp.]